MSNRKNRGTREISSDTLIVGVDIGSRVHTAHFTTITNKDLGELSFSNDRRGFEAFWSTMINAKILGGCRDILLGFESTGPYGEPFHHFLSRMSVRQVQVNPMHTKKAKDMCDNTPLKSDKKDSKVIADIIRIGRWISRVEVNGVRASLRRLSNLRSKNVRDRTAHINRLRQSYYLVFPEFSKVIKDIRSKTALYLIKKYPLPEDYESLNVDELSEELRKISRGRFGKKEALALIEEARTSTGIKDGVDAILLEVSQIIEQLELLNGFIFDVEKDIKRILKTVPESKNIMSIKGFKEVTAAAIIGEVGDFAYFNTIDEILKFSGLNLYEVSSGLHKGQVHITKVGRGFLRKTLYFASLNTVRKDGVMHDYYQRCLGRGMAKTKALIAVSRKLLRIIFSLVKNNTMFDENYNKRIIMKKAA